MKEWRSALTGLSDCRMLTIYSRFVDYFQSLLVFLTVFICTAHSVMASSYEIDFSDVEVAEGGDYYLRMTMTPAHPTTDFSFGWQLYGVGGNPITPTSDFTSDSYMGEKFFANRTSYDVAMMINDDSLAEGTETGSICILPSTPGFDTASNRDFVNGGGEDCWNIRLLDNEATPPTISFSSSLSSGPESTAGASLPLTLSNSWTSDITVSYTVSGTAVAGTDYTAASGSLLIPSGKNSANLDISGIVDDAIYEGPETIIVTLTSATAGTIGSADTHTYTITGNDSQPSVQFSLSSSTVNETTSSATLQLQLSNPTTSAVSLSYTVAGTATSIGGADYTALSGTATIPALATTADITVSSINNDNVYEGNETVIVTLSSSPPPGNASLGSQTQHTLTIIDDESQPSFSINDDSVNEGDSSSAATNLTITLSGPSAYTTQVDYATADGTATTADSDYTATSGTAILNPLATSFSVPVSVLGDTWFGADETVTVNLTNADNATISDSTGVLTITNDDTRPSLSISPGPMNVESTNGSVNIDLSSAAEIDVTFDHSTTDGTALAGAHYTAATGTGVTVSAGQTSKTVNLSFTDDTDDNADRDFAFNISNAGHATIAEATETITIIDDDLAVSIGDVTVNEGAGTATLTVTVTGPSLSSYVDLDYSTNAGTASASDYTAASNVTHRITSSAGSPPYFSSAETSTFTINITDDAVLESSEYFDVTLSNMQNATGTLTDDTGRVTITDNDTAVIDFNLTSSSASEGAGTASLRIDLSTTASSDVTVGYAVTGGSATGGGVDYTLASGTATITSGTTFTTISVPLVDDSVADPSETIEVSLSGPSSGVSLGTDNVHTLTITDDDAAPSSDPNQALVDEAILDTQTIIAKHVSTQGKSLLHASQNLIQTSIDHLIVRTQLQAKRRSRGAGTQTASRTPAPTGQTPAGQTPAGQRSAGTNTPAPPSPAGFTDEDSFADRLTSAVKLLELDADDFGYRGALDFDLYEPLSGRNSAFITKITVSMSDQDNGPETNSLMASFALETETEDGETIYGRFLHLTQTKADFRHSQSGTQDSQGISGGIYTVYSPKVDHLLTAFVSFGVAQTDLDLAVSSAAVKDSFNSLNAQAGVSLARTVQRPGVMMVWEMAAESLISRQQSRYASVLVGGSAYRAQINSRTVTDTSAIFTPKFIFDLNEDADESPANLQLAPSVRCGSGTGGSSCGYGLSTSFSQMMTGGDGHMSFGLSADRYRNTDTISYFIDINRSLLGHKGIRFDTHLKQVVTGGSSSGLPDYRINSVVRLPL